MSERLFEDRFELAQTLAGEIARSLGVAIAVGREASLVVSGGSTPRALFGALRKQEQAWTHIVVTLADERFVASTDERSNERLVQELLLSERAADARFVSLMSDATSAAEAAAQCASALASVPRPFDVVVLGMGNDGHFASLFPGTTGPGLDPESDVVCVATSPEGLEPRISLTLAALLHCRRLILHLHGADKWEVYRAARAGGSGLPIERLLDAASERLEVWWAP